MTFKKTVDGALYMFELGYKVFPLKSNEKTPAIEGWQNWAETATQYKIESYATAQPMANWGVYCGASKLVVLDVDNKDSKVGNESLKALIADNSKLPNTLTVVTPTKGYHIYFSGSAKNSASSLAKDLDIRGEGGYVVCPGSRIDNLAYEITEDYPVSAIPEWLSTKLSTLKKEKTVLQEGVLIEEGGRNNQLASFGGKMRDLGSNEEMILATLNAMNETLLSSPLPQWEVETIARSMMRYPVGHASAALTFAPIVDDEEEMAYCSDNFDYADTKPTDWVMDNRYAIGFITLLSSQGGVGKSTFTWAEALAVATGKPLTNRHVKAPINVWVYNTEDPNNMIREKMEAVSVIHTVHMKKLSSGKKVYWTSGTEKPFLLMTTKRNEYIVNDALVEKTIRYIKKKDIKLFIVDPLVSTHRVSENDSGAMDMLMDIWQRIAIEAKCAVATVHHVSKSGSKSLEIDMNDSRGSSAIPNAARLAFVISNMNEKESIKFNVPETERIMHLKVDCVKNNLGTLGETVWLKKNIVGTQCGGSAVALSLSNLIDRTIEKKDEEMEMDRKDLAKALWGIMNIGDMMKVSNVWGQIKIRPVHEHVFDSKESKRGQDQLMKLLTSGEVRCKDKKFNYVFVKENPRFNHWVSCEASNSVVEVINDPMDEITLVGEDDTNGSIEADYDFLK